MDVQLHVLPLAEPRELVAARKSRGQEWRSRSNTTPSKTPWICLDTGSTPWDTWETKRPLSAQCGAPWSLSGQGDPGPQCYGTPRSAWEFPPNSPLNELLEDAPTQVLADLLNVGLGRTRGSALAPQGHPGHPYPIATWGSPPPLGFHIPPLPLPGHRGCFCHCSLWGPQHHQPWGALG